MYAWLVGLFGAALSGLFQWLLQYLTRKAAVTVVVVATFASLTAAFIVGIKALLTGIAVAADGTALAYMGWLIPDNGPACVSAIIAAKVARWIYDHQVKALWNAANLTLK